MSKNEKWDLIKLKRFFTTKKTINKNKKIMYGMVKNIGKQWDQQGINFQNKQIAFCIQNYKYNSISKKQNPAKKTDRRLK